MTTRLEFLIRVLYSTSMEEQIKPDKFVLVWFPIKFGNKLQFSSLKPQSQLKFNCSKYKSVIETK